MDSQAADFEVVEFFRDNNQNYLEIGHRLVKKTRTISVANFVQEHRDKLRLFSDDDMFLIIALCLDKVCPVIKKNQFPSSFWLLHILVVLQLSFLVAANFMSAKVMHIWGIDIVAGALCFPFTYSLSDLIVELYGFTCARGVVFLTLSANLLVVFLLQCAIAMPASPLWIHQTEFELVFHQSSAVFMASIAAFLIGNLCNSYLFSLCKEKWIFMPFLIRLILCCLIGFFIDSIIFLVVAHKNTLSGSAIFNMVMHVYFHKVLYELATAGFISQMLKMIKHKYKHLGHEPLTFEFRMK